MSTKRTVILYIITSMRAHSTLSQEQEQQQQEEVKQKFAGVILRAAPAAKNKVTIPI